MNTEREQLPLHLGQLNVQPVLPGHVWQVLSHLISVELGNVDYNIKLSENPQGRFSHHRREQDVGVSDDAFDRHQNPF
jgi:hypothetical protein